MAQLGNCSKVVHTIHIKNDAIINHGYFIVYNKEFNSNKNSEFNINFFILFS